MPNNDYILRGDAVSALCGNCEATDVCRQLGEPCEDLIAEKRAEIERLEAEIAKMPPLDYEKLAANPPEYPVCIGYKCWDGKEADNGTA